jgi:chitodextrinase
MAVLKVKDPITGQWIPVAAGSTGGGGSGGDHVDPTNTTAYGLLVNDNNNVSAVPLTELVRPIPPTGLSVQVGLTFVRLTWTAVSGASSYTVYRNGTFLLTTTATSYRDNSIVVNTLYTYTIRSANRFGMRGGLSAGVDAYPDSANNSVPRIGIVAWPATNAPGQKQVIRVTASDIDAQDLALLINVNVGALEATKDPSVWLLTI